MTVPDTCEICGSWTGAAWDVHQVLAHPETRPRPEWAATEKGKKGKGKKK